eukprot:1385914-Rhodomonas_salina.2
MVWLSTGQSVSQYRAPRRKLGTVRVSPSSDESCPRTCIAPYPLFSRCLSIAIWIPYPISVAACLERYGDLVPGGYRTKEGSTVQRVASATRTTYATHASATHSDLGNCITYYA